MTRPESLSYDEAEHNFITARHELSAKERRLLRVRLTALTVSFMLIVGVLVGSSACAAHYVFYSLLLTPSLFATVAYSITFLVTSINRAKWGAINYHWHDGSYGQGYLVTLLFTLALAFTATSLTLWAPQAAGSGIPVVKSYLNGNKLVGILRLRTLIAKVLGISCSVAIGLPVGREGPMVHAGAIAASFTARKLSIFLKGKIGRDYGGFDNDYHRRNFVSMGAAAGVAAAFHAPIGGILFSLEEVRVVSSHSRTHTVQLSAATLSTAMQCHSLTPRPYAVLSIQVSSFWDPKLTLNSFICASVSAFIVQAWAQVRSLCLNALPAPLSLSLSHQLLALLLLSCMRSRATVYSLTTTGSSGGLRARRYATTRTASGSW